MSIFRLRNAASRHNLDKPVVTSRSVLAIKLWEMIPSLGTLALATAIVIGVSIFFVKQKFQVPPPSLAERNLTCAKQQGLCSFVLERAPDDLTKHGRWSRAARNPNVGDESDFQFKRWNYVSFTDEHYFVGAAIVQFSYISDVFLYVVEKATQKEYTYTGRIPLGLNAQIAYSSTHGCSRWGAPQSNINDPADRPWMELCTSETDGLRFRASVPVTNDASETLQARMDVVMETSNHEDLALAYPLNGMNGRLVYVHKLAGVPLASGSKLLLHGDREHIFTKAVGGLDWTKGRVLYRTVWRWVSLNEAHAMVSRNGKPLAEELVGINFSQDVYDVVSESGDVFSSENAVWVNGKVYPLNVPIEVTVPAHPRADQWTIRSKSSDEDSFVNLVFKPLGAREDHTNFGIVLSDFIQPYGRFSGQIRVVDAITGERIVIHLGDKTSFGVVENHVAYW